MLQISEMIDKIDSLVKKGIVSYSLIAEALSIQPKIDARSQNYISATIDNSKVVIKENSYGCSCEVFQRKKICKHVLALAFYAGKKYTAMILDHLEQLYSDKLDETKVLLTGISGLDKITGGLPRNGIVGIFGPSKIGKTLLVSQIAYTISHNFRKPAIYIDTEGFFTGETKRTFDNLFSRFNNADVKIIDAYNLESLMRLLGLELILDYREKKMEAQILFTSQPLESPLFRFANLMNSTIIVIDSFTMPIKRIFGSGTQNLPARSAIINAFFARLEEISMTLEIPIIVTHHAGRSPINPADYYKPYGGSSLLYNLKYLLLLLPHREDENKRRIYRYAWPGMPRDEEEVVLERDYGYK